MYSHLHTNQALAEEYINFMLSDDAAIANAEYICYASPHSNVYTSEIYQEDMGEDAIEILYPEDFDFAAAYDANCYKDLDKDTKAYINALWSKYATNQTADNGCGSTLSVSAVIFCAVITLGTGLVFKKKRKNK